MGEYFDRAFNNLYRYISYWRNPDDALRVYRK